MRGHTGLVVDLAFFGNESPHAKVEGDVDVPDLDLIASTGKDGNVFVWKLSCPTADTVLYLSYILMLHFDPQ